MSIKEYPVIDLVATGNNIRRLRIERGLTVRDLQSYFGFEAPRAIYKWQKGTCLPTVDNLYALGNLFEIPMDQILVPVSGKPHMVSEQQAGPCCSNHFMAGYWGHQNHSMQLRSFARSVRQFCPVPAGSASSLSRNSCQSNITPYASINRSYTVW